MRKLDTIQTENRLNEVYALDEAGCGNASHSYRIVPVSNNDALSYPSQDISFQHGPRNNSDSIAGVLDTDLLEIVRDRLIGFQSGEFACRENAIALTHIEDALLWLDKRVRDRNKRGVLGTEQK